MWLGDLPVAVLAPAGPLYVAPDNLGAPHQITTAAGHVVWFWDHEPFGVGDPTGSFTYNLRFPGQYYDRETKLTYNYFRDYDPKLGRYVESDPIGMAGGTNTYAYVGGNPANFVDPHGLWRLPDYINANINIAIPTPWTGTVIGWSGTASLDRYGDWFWSSCWRWTRKVGNDCLIECDHWLAGSRMYSL